MWQEKTLELGDGRSLWTAQAGKGPDVVLIHGALTTSHDWQQSPVVSALAENWRVTVVDRPGHGHSRRPRFAGTPREQADQIILGLDRLGVDRFIAVGHSFGGLVTLALAERHAARLSAMVLVAPIAFPELRVMEHSVLALRALPLAGPFLSWLGKGTKLDRSALPMLQKMMFHPAEVPAGWEESYPVDLALDPRALVFEGEDAVSILPFSPAGTVNVAAIQTRAHVVTGTADKVVEDERQGKALARLLPNGEMTEIVGAGHMLHHSHPEAVLAAIRKATASAG